MNIQQPIRGWRGGKAVAGDSVSPAAPGPSNASRRRAIIEALGGKYRLVPVIFVLALIWAFFWTRSPDFLTSSNMTNLCLQVAVTSTVALGLVFLLLIGEIDLSVVNLGAVAAAVAAILVVNHGVSAPIAIGVALAIGAAWGFLEGRFFTALRVPSFIITLAGALVLQGVLLLILPAQTSQIPLFGTSLQPIASTYLTPATGYGLGGVAIAIYLLARFDSYVSARRAGHPTTALRAFVLPTVAMAVVTLAVVAVLNRDKGVPVITAVIVAVTALMSFVLRQTRFGTAFYALGGNAEAARRRGVPINRIRTWAFVITGVFAAAAGIIAASRVLAVSNESTDTTALLEGIAAAVVGGTSLFGGRGSVWSALIGALVIGSIANGLYLLDASTPVTLIIEGGVLALAVATDALLLRASGYKGTA